jgi:hypothetical protein
LPVIHERLAARAQGDDLAIVPRVLKVVSDVMARPSDAEEQQVGLLETAHRAPMAEPFPHVIQTLIGWVVRPPRFLRVLVLAQIHE